MHTVQFDDLFQTSSIPHHFLHLNASTNTKSNPDDKHKNNNEKQRITINNLETTIVSTESPEQSPSSLQPINQANSLNNEEIEKQNIDQREKDTQADSSSEPVQDDPQIEQTPNSTSVDEHITSTDAKLTNEQQIEQSQSQSNPNTSTSLKLTPHQPALSSQFDATTNMFSFIDDGVVALFFGNALPRTENSFILPDGERSGAEQGDAGGDETADFLNSNTNHYEYSTPATDRSPPTAHETESHDSGGGVDTSGLAEGRVEASKMGQVDNPLQKRGRHTVITGHLPYDNPYSVAERNLGIKMCSLKLQSKGVPPGMSREEAFARDLHEFLVEINMAGSKVPVIGGGPLDLFALMREVLLLGGVTNVVKKRAFRIVGQQLELPKSCTSAAFVLKNAYTRLLFYYEGKLVFDQVPEKPCRNVNIKQLVAADKERDRMQAKIRNNQSTTTTTINNPSCQTPNGDDRKRRLNRPMPTSMSMSMYSIENETELLQSALNYEMIEMDNENDNDIANAQVSEEPVTKRVRLSSDFEQQPGIEEFIGDILPAPTPLGSAADYEFSQGQVYFSCADHFFIN